MCWPVGTSNVSFQPKAAVEVCPQMNKSSFRLQARADQPLTSARRAWPPRITAACFWPHWPGSGFLDSDCGTPCRVWGKNSWGRPEPFLTSLPLSTCLHEAGISSYTLTKTQLPGCGLRYGNPAVPVTPDDKEVCRTAKQCHSSQEIGLGLGYVVEKYGNAYMGL